MLVLAPVTTHLLQIGEPAAPVPESTWQERLAALKAWLSPYRRVLVAYSGGVDSSMLLRVAHDVLGEGATGVIGRSDSYAQRELALALEQAEGFGAGVMVVTTGELSDPNFRSNPTDRCYHCKTQLYQQLSSLATRLEADVVVDGTIADDLGDWRPGRRAAAERDVRSPLADLGFTKADVRAVAAAYGLPSREKPASPCLASRIPYGMEITPGKLAMVEAAEDLLRSEGFAELRVRHHGDVARIEVPLGDLPRVLAPGTRERLADGLKALGFRHITLDLEGFRPGNLNPPALQRRETGLDGAQSVKES